MVKEIMIVDDDSDILVSLRLIFEHQKFKVITVDSGMDCIKELERGFKGIVLLDLMMPFMDGWETLKQIITKGLNKDIVLSIITANTNSEKNQIFEPFIYNFIPKPFDLEQLITEVKKLAESKQLKD